LEAGKIPVETVPFSLENIIVQTGKTIKQLHLQNPVELKISISDKIKDTIFESDPLRIRQIINNLVGNAFKFTKEGSVVINVEEVDTLATLSTPKISKIKVSVIDTGIGISKEKQELIFNEFTQAETDTAHKFGGSGLGLAISKKLTELLGGTLKVSSIPNEGSTFSLILPLKNSDRVLAKIPYGKSKSFSGLKAVIIDDDSAMRELLKEVFEQMDIVSDAFSSFSVFKNPASDFDFILTDIQMPGTDGFSILKKLKNGETEFYNGQPVIAMTGSKEHLREYYLEKGFAEMLPKPFTKQDLLETIEHIFPEKINLSKKLKPIETVQKYTSDKFDLTLLQSFLNTPESMEEVLSVFYAQTETHMLQLKKAIGKKDFETIGKTAHRMLTMFRQLKAIEVIPVLEKMEHYRDKIETENEIEVRYDYEKLSVNVRALQKALKNRKTYNSIS
jgi:CheY-like chemotaxis protein